MPALPTRLFVTFLLHVLALAFAAPLHAAPTNIAAELVSEGPVAPGQTGHVAILMRPSPGWHGYWSNPGDAGLGMTLEWTAPTLSFGAPAYPVPETLVVSGLMNHVYAHDYAVLVPVTVSAGASAGSTIPLRLVAKWLACTDKICVPEEAELTGALKVGSGPRDPRFDGWRQALPAPLGSPARFALTDKLLRVAIPLPATVALNQPHFFVGEDRVVDYAAVQTWSRDGDTAIVEIPRAKVAPDTPATLTGVIRLARDSRDGLAVTAAPGEVPATGKLLATANGSPVASLPVLLLAALAGGLLLNVMPCVFPILSLKALSLARAGESEAEARREGLAYTAGVILACLALGALLLALRAGGSQIGWAFQLQEPLVVAALLLLATALTANFLGLFEFGVPGFVGAANPRGAFATGLLAAFVATPCTGPFMAMAMGAALLLPTVPALLLFATLGLGIALPFLAVAFIPALRRRLPKPGPWMVRFRRWMALPMGLTALALLWLASRVGGWTFATAAFVATLALIATLVHFGQQQRRGRSGSQALAMQLAALTLVAAIALPRFVATPEAASASLLAPRSFSEAALGEARASDKTVFVWFTADWCLTCKVNEQVAIERDEVAKAFRENGVIAMRGDWTRRDPAITRFLTARGAAGVPLYLWYAPGRAEPEQLPQVLPPGALVERAAAR